jgi:hypothetical protein
VSDYSYREILLRQIYVKPLADNNIGMPDIARTVAICCYTHRAVVLTRCDLCKPEYACPEFKTKSAVVQFNAMIPASMLLVPLPIELWPNMCGGASPDRPTHRSASNESIDSPVRRFGSTLGLADDLDPDST